MDSDRRDFVRVALLGLGASLASGRPNFDAPSGQASPTDHPLFRPLGRTSSLHKSQRFDRKTAQLIAQWCRKVKLGGSYHDLKVAPSAVYQTAMRFANVHSYAISVDSADVVAKILQTTSTRPKDLERTVGGRLGNLHVLGGILSLHRKVYCPSPTTAKHRNITKSGVVLNEDVWWLDIYVREAGFALLRVYHDSLDPVYSLQQPTQAAFAAATAVVKPAFVEHDDVILDWHSTASLTGLAQSTAYLRAAFRAARDARIIVGEYAVDVAGLATQQFRVGANVGDNATFYRYFVPCCTNPKANSAYGPAFGIAGRSYASPTAEPKPWNGLRWVLADDRFQAILYDPSAPLLSSSELTDTAFTVSAFEYLKPSRLVTYTSPLFQHAPNASGSGVLTSQRPVLATEWPGAEVRDIPRPQFQANSDMDLFVKAAVKRSPDATYMGNGFFRFKSADLVSKLAANTGTWGSGPANIITIATGAQKVATGANLIGAGAVVVHIGTDAWLEDHENDVVNECKQKSQSPSECRKCVATSSVAVAHSLALSADAIAMGVGIAAIIGSTGIGIPVLLAVAAIGAGAWYLLQDGQAFNEAFDKCG
jgi:hypothetical protein